MSENNYEQLAYEMALLTTEIRGIRVDLDKLLIKVDTDRLLSANELSKRLGVSVNKIMAMTKEKTIPHMRAGSRYLFKYNEVLKSIEVKPRK